MCRAVAAGALSATLLTSCTASSTLPGASSPPPPLEPVPARQAHSATLPILTTNAVPPARLAAGVHVRQVEVDGQVRRWTVVVPSRPVGILPAGLLIVLHGVGASGPDMRSAGFESAAAPAGIVMAYPDGLGGAWNDGRPGVDPVVPGVTVDDVRFLRLLIDDTLAATGADGRRVAVAGFSNGAIMAARVACDLADRVLAVALVAGSAGQGFQQSCRPAGPVAMMVVAGSDDRTVPYGGGRVANWGSKKRGFVAPVEDLFAFWLAQGGCASTTVSSVGRVSEAGGAGCRAETAVVRYQIRGGGHEWYRAPAFDTTGAIWNFVSRRFSTVPEPPPEDYTT